MVNTVSIKKILTGFTILLGSGTLLTFIITAVVLSNRGFEMSDEAFYLFCSNHKLKDGFLTTNFGILNNFFCFGNPTLVNLRVCKLILQLLAALCFFFGVHSYLLYKNIRPEKGIVIITGLLILISVFINYDYLPMSLSYNSWSLVLSLFAFSLLLFDFRQRAKPKIILSGFLYGIICFASFLSKFPNFFILLLLFFVVHFFVIKQHVLLRSVSLIAGIIFGGIIFVHDWELFLLICSNYYDILFRIQYLKGHSYLDDLRGLKNGYGGLRFIVLQLFLFFYTLYSNKLFCHKKMTSLIFYGLLILNFCFGVDFIKGNGENLSNDFILESIFFLNALYYLLYREPGGQNKIINKRSLIVILLLVSIPILSSLGTTNPFYYNSSHFFIFLIGGCLLAILLERKETLFFLVLNCGFLCAFSISILYNGAIKNPYRQTNLAKKVYPLHYKQADGILESYETFVDYTAIEMIMQRLKTPVNTFFTCASYMGVAFISGSDLQPPTWITDNDQHINSARFILKKGRFNSGISILLLPLNVSQSAKFRNLFREFNVNLDDNYKLAYTYKCVSSGEIIYFYKHS